MRVTRLLLGHPLFLSFSERSFDHTYALNLILKYYDRHLYHIMIFIKFA